MRAFLVVGLLAAACQPTAEARADSPPEPPAKRFEHDMMMRYHMRENLDLTRGIERLLIAGRFDEAKGFARDIADSPIDPALGPWTTEAALVRVRAAALAVAPGLDEACRRTGALAAACAGCHVEARVQPEFRAPPPLPPALDTVPARMARHRWAADRLWEGIVGGDDESWASGLAVVATAPLPWPALDGRAALARRLQRLASTAQQRRATDSLADRGATYGELLVTCAACHAASAAVPAP